MSAPELSTFLNRNVEALLSAFPQWRFDKSVVRRRDENMPTRVYHSSKANGLQVEGDAAGVVKVIFAYASGVQGCGQYRHPVAGVEFSWDREKIRALLGIPSQVTEAKSFSDLGSYGPSDRYDYATHSIHFQYHRSEPRVDLITLMTADRVPKPLPK